MTPPVPGPGSMSGPSVVASPTSTAQPGDSGAGKHARRSGVALSFVEPPMTRIQLERSVARRTGESLATIRHLGFHVQADRPEDLEPEDLHLAVDCPFCGASTPLPSDSGGLSALAECDRCDVDFDYDPAEV